MDYDLVVLGLGGMGSAVAAHAARRGLRVAGFERFGLVHELGSSVGRTRIIRRAYFEDAAYVPLLDRAYTLWRELEEQSHDALLDLFGVLMIGTPDSTTIRGMAAAAQTFDIPIDQLDATQLRARFPQLALERDEVGLFEPDAGVVFPERAVAAHLKVARDHGAHLYDRARVRAYEPDGGGVTITFEGNESVKAARLALCTGAWTSEMLAGFALPLRVQRNVQYWFATSQPAYGPADLPAFFFERATLPAPIYGIPDLGDGLKVAFHGYGATTRADDLDRDIHDDEVEVMRETLQRLMPDSQPQLRSAKACMYTMTPDANFAIGRDPNHPNIVVAAGFSGHGFKFAPAIGEIVVQLLLDETPPYDLGFLGLERLLSGT
jgi:sarcosine oxidase